MRKNFTSEQMLYTVRQAESGTPVAEVCRKVGITEQTFYKWKRPSFLASVERLKVHHRGTLFD
jgi:putative transposase